MLSMKLIVVGNDRVRHVFSGRSFLEAGTGDAMPAGSIVEIVQYPCSISDRMAIVMVNGKVMTMFSHDVRNCAEEIKSDAA